MTGAFSAQTTEMLAASDLAADAAADLKAELDRLLQKWEDLSGTWRGLAASAYAPEVEQWRAGAEKAIAALDSSSILLAQHAYTFTDIDGGSAGSINSAIPG